RKHRKRDTSSNDKRGSARKLSDYRDQKSEGEKRPFNPDRSKPFGKNTEKRPYKGGKRNFSDRSYDPSKTKRERTGAAESFKRTYEDEGLIRLNRYIANSGVCSRRKADELIEAGVV